MDRVGAIIASGPSLTPEDADRCRDLFTISVGCAFRYGRPDIVYHCDRAWWDAYHAEARETGAALWTGSRQAARAYGLQRPPMEPGNGLSRRAVRHNRNSGAQAIGLAVHLGYTRLLLLGFDCRSNGARHFHGDYPGRLNKPHPYDNWLVSFGAVAADAGRSGITIINCTRDTALTCFPRSSLEDEIERIR